MADLVVDIDNKKGDNIIETVTDKEMQDFFIWLQENNKLNTQLLSIGFFEYTYIHQELQKFRAEKKRV